MTVFVIFTVTDDGHGQRYFVMNNWRLLIDGPKSGYENMATDEAILQSCNEGLSQPTLRLYEWNTPTLSIGCFQKADTIIKTCLDVGVPFVRRITGGRAVLHSDEITYSIICSEDEPLFGEGISGAYRIINTCLLEALKEAGINAEMHASCARPYSHKRSSCFHSPSKYEIIVDNKKLVGSAQKRLRNAFIQHGSILFGIDKDIIPKLFGGESLSRMAWVGLYNDITRHDFKTILIDKIEKGLNIKLTVGNINDDERYLKQLRIKNYDYKF